MTKCEKSDIHSVCIPVDITKDVTTCKNCNRQMHWYNGQWYHWHNLPAEADNSEWAFETKRAIEQLKKENKK